jgi:hypothetical protein
MRKVDSDPRCVKVAANERPEAPTAIRIDLGAIFISLELSRSKWLITSLSPGGGEKMSKHAMAADDIAGLLMRFAELKRRAQARTGRCFPIIVIQDAQHLQQRRRPKFGQGSLPLCACSIIIVDTREIKLVIVDTREVNPYRGSRHSQYWEQIESERVVAELYCPWRMKSAARSAIMIVGALMLPPIRSGNAEASTTRKPLAPRTRSLSSTTAIGSASVPILQVPAG